MTYRDGQDLGWDIENRLISVSANATTIAQFFYDGDGNRVKKIEGGETILYINKYYEVNLTAGNFTSYYYSGNTLVAKSENSTLMYVHQDHLTSTSLMTDSTGAQVGTTVKYLPFGETRSGSVPTDKLFTGQRLDSTGLYFYNARYYDPEIGRFLSPDTIVPNLANPQTLNRYSYCVNNPLKYTDPSGHAGEEALAVAAGAAFIPGWGWIIAAGALVVYGGIILEQQTGVISSLWNAAIDWFKGENQKPPIWVPPPTPPTIVQGTPTNPLPGGWPSGPKIVRILIGLGLITMATMYMEQTCNPDVGTQGPVPKDVPGLLDGGSEPKLPIQDKIATVYLYSDYLSSIYNSSNISSPNTSNSTPNTSQNSPPPNYNEAAFYFYYYSGFLTK